MMCTSGSHRVSGGLYRTLRHHASLWEGAAQGCSSLTEPLPAPSTRGLKRELSARAHPEEPRLDWSHALPGPMSYEANSWDSLTGQQRPCFIHQKASCMILHAFYSHPLFLMLFCFYFILTTKGLIVEIPSNRPSKCSVCF